MKSIIAFLKNILTEVDNETFEIGRVLWAISVTIGLTLTVTAFFTGNAFDLQAYGVGTGTLLGAGGIVNALKSHVENKPK